MMKKSLFTLLALVFTISSCFAQGGVLPLTAQAAREYQEGNYHEAKKHIDESINGEGAEDAYTWQVRGHIYKEIYKADEKAIMESSHRDEAVNSFQKCMKLDTENKYLEWNRTSLRFLASTFWNDAVSVMDKRDRATIHKAQDFFERYLEIMKEARPADETDKFALDFYRAYATANRKIIEQRRNLGAQPEDYAKELERVKESYRKALDIDPEDYGSNYNLSINLYNEGSYRIEQIPAEVDLTDLLIRQAGAKDIFAEALPIAEKANEIRAGRIETLKALRAIHLALNNYDKFDEFNKLVREKQGELIIDGDTQRELDRSFFRRERIKD